MRQMRLSTMADSFENRISTGDHQDLTNEEYLSFLVDDEFVARKNRKLSRMLTRANFKPQQACIENIIYNATRGFKKQDIMPFTSKNWIDNSQNLILMGPTGCGKTYLAEAIGFHACKSGYPTVKKRYRLLFEEIRAAKGTGMYLKYLTKLSKVKVLIIDDFLMHPVDIEDIGSLMDIIDEKEQTGSIIITTQFPLDQWHKKFPEPTIADAICDRLIHKAVKLNLQGESMRKINKNNNKEL